MVSKAVLKKPVLEAFVAASNRSSYPPQRKIIGAGEAPRGLYLILEGSVSVMVEATDGREMVLAYLNPGEFFGEMCLFPEQQVRTAIVRAREPTLVAGMKFEDFREFHLEHPDIMFELAGQLAARLRETSRRLRDLTFLDVATRLTHALYELTRQPDAKKTSRGTLVRISRKELSGIVGCSREMSGRVLKKLEEDGLITFQGHRIIVPQDAALSKFRLQKPA
jgi:CRP/FNR family cyclic AMP-dependent transcriptional regulator